MPRKHIVYRTTNLINGEYYVGKHSLSERSAVYLGSGTRLRRAIKKYGRENFIRETLFEFDTVDECLRKEQKIVNIDLVNDPKCYNISTGGMGGRTQHRETREAIATAVKEEWKNNQERKIANSIAMKHRNAEGISGPASYTDESRKQLSIKTTERWSDVDYKARVSTAISKGKMGYKQSVEHHRANIAAQNRTRHCEYCNQEHKLAAYGRWHGDSCKEKT